MKHNLPELPYAKDALEPYISRETLEYHHDKHHRAYVEKLNSLIPKSKFEDDSLEDIVLRSSGEIFNNAAQAWNHEFYWQCLAPPGGGDPPEALSGDIISAFGSFDEFKRQFSQVAENTFGSGWAWLTRNKAGSLQIVGTRNADNPMVNGQTPLLTCDVWEHAYYIDYRNARPDYLQAFWSVVNWDFVSKNGTTTPKSSRSRKQTTHV